jgi:carboxymethylenebutenolidase
VAKLPECIGRVAVLGYCLGGLMTFLTAARYGVDAAVVYHGGDTEKYLDEIDGLDAPLLAEDGDGECRPDTAGMDYLCCATPKR